MRIYFVRHSQSEANVLRVISNRDLPHHLTDLGRQQAEALARSLADVPLTALYSSPILRATETAQIVAASKGLPIQIADALREPDCGIMEGRGDDEAWAEYDRVRVAWMQDQLDSRIAGGESFSDVRARWVPLIDRLVVSHGNTQHHLLLITHGALLYFMLPLVLTNLNATAARQYPLPNTGVIIAEQRANKLVCLEWYGVKLAE